MKRSVAVVLAVLLFVLITAGGAALMYFSPRGILNPNSPEAAIQNYIDTNAYNWKEEFLKLYTADVTPFEDAASVTEEIYTSLTGGEAIPSGSGKAFPAGMNRFSFSRRLPISSPFSWLMITAAGRSLHSMCRRSFSPPKPAASPLRCLLTLRFL